MALLGRFMSWFSACLSSRTDFEVVQAYMHRFLKLHSEVIAENDALKEQAEVSPRAEPRAASLVAVPRALPGRLHRHPHATTPPPSHYHPPLTTTPPVASPHQELAEAQREAGRHVRELLQQNLCLIKFFCNAQVV